MGCYTEEVSLHILRRDPVLGVGLLCNLIIRIGGNLCCSTARRASAGRNTRKSLR
jgi:hypothetical protein